MTTTCFTPLDLEKTALPTSGFDDTPITLLWGAGTSKVSYFRRFLTPEERLVRSVARGGFPLLRQELCQPLNAPLAASVHASLEALESGRSGK